MTTRSIELIIDQFRASLQEDNSDLADFPTFGNLYTIYRSIATLIQEQDEKLETTATNIFINTASGVALENRASEFNIRRNAGARATGSIIILGNIPAIPINTVLTDLNTGLQFTTLNRINMRAGRGVGIINSTELTPLANLRAGTELFSSIYPNLRFIVGTNYDVLTSTYIGNLIGGAYREDDDEFRSRILDTLNNLSSSSIRSLELSLLNINGVSRVFIQENEPSLGYITIYINNADRTIIKNVEAALEFIKPVGTATIVKSFIPVTINIDLVVTTYNQTNLSNLNSSIRLALTNYLNNISLNNTLTIEGIAGSVLNIAGIVNVEVLNPTSNTIISANEILSLGTLNINYT